MWRTVASGIATIGRARDSDTHGYMAAHKVDSFQQMTAPSFGGV
jgi:hypothetical protein